MAAHSPIRLSHFQKSHKVNPRQDRTLVFQSAEQGELVVAVQEVLALAVLAVSEQVGVALEALGVRAVEDELVALQRALHDIQDHTHQFAQ